MSELDWTITKYDGWHQLRTNLYVSPTHSMQFGADTNGYVYSIFNGKTDIVNTDITCWIWEGTAPWTYLFLRLQATDEVKNGYAAGIRMESARIYRIQNDTWTLLASGEKPDMHYQWARYKFRVKNNHLELYQEIDGSWSKLLEADDDTFASGAAGFGIISPVNGAAVYFDDVQISEEV